MQENRLYSMMGRIKSDNLEGIYGQGEWHQFRDLNEVLQMMQEDENEYRDKHSIPDVFGRAIQYKISFESARKKSEREKKYIFSQEILDWRGIITAIALKDFLELKMKIEILEYDKEEAGKSEQKSDKKENGFDKALKYPPEAEIFPMENNWKKGRFHILMMEGDNGGSYIDIGMFSPLTAIYPIADLAEKMPRVKKINWVDRGGRFLNPVEKLNETEKMIVYFWLEELRTALIEKGGNIETIDYHLNAYSEELKNAIRTEHLAEKQCFKMITLDENCEEIAQDIEISSVINRTVRLHMTGAYEIDYKDLFADQIYYTEGKKNPFTEYCEFEESHKIQSRLEKGMDWYAFLPIGRKLAEINNKNKELVRAIAKNMKMRVEYEESVRYVCVKLSLSKIPEISQKEIDIEKRYYGESLIKVEEADFPVIGIWPKYNLNCKRYYVYLYGGKAGKVETLLKDSEQKNNPFVKAVNYFPQTISLQRLEASETSGEDRKLYDIGMILPAYHENEQEESAPVEAKVGIDFGTSGTTVYVRIGGASSTMIDISDDGSALFTQADMGDMGMLNDWFIADKRKRQKEAKLQSVYRRASAGPIKNAVPVLDGIIYQADEKEMIVADARYMPNIKWDDTTNGDYYKAFIEELCVHIWMILQKNHVSSVEWRYAFPGNYDKKDIYEGIWKNEISEFLKERIGIPGQILQNKKYTESEAASLYFQRSGQLQMVNVDKGYMVVDIGGGSTDIAVWQKLQDNDREAALLAQTSVPVAGRLLFTRWIALNMPEIQTSVSPDKKEWRELVKYVDSKDIVNAVIERIVQNNQNDIMRAYQGEADWTKILREQLEFGVALLFFALGSFIGHLREMNILKTQDRNGYFSIAVGGNGSRILPWAEERKEEKKFFRLLGMFQAGIESRLSVSDLYDSQIIMSDRPKEEVALGLLEEKEGGLKKASDNIDITENITDEMAVIWNRLFLDAYNRLFSRKRKIDEKEIPALMAGNNRKMDVCNFFMDVLYKKYYLKRMKETGGGKEKE